MEPTLYSLVLGPRGGEESSFDRALAANVVDARSCALMRDSHGEAMAHQEINKLLDLREKGI
ncbi:MAG TPA: hypothetical protein VN520_14280 [Streptomyces sp.]|uniref:hypothetical protein n=1 Tax=Streptomyces sp. TaxID=1931 RepID=UPI002BFB370B|nr:hypothetical protein [Streptomyces sp.]HWU07525.1 hypothetical protein [Streptomyces sp.]